MLPRWTRGHVTLIALLFASAQLPAHLAAQSSGRPSAAAATEARTDSVAVANALRRFLTAFENLDWPAFRAAFSDSATIFQPAPQMAERVTGPRGIDSTFGSVFAEIRSHAPSGPPYQRLAPRDLRIEPLSPGFVLVTFHLRNSERLGRRTVIFRKEGSEWLIWHLHASNLPPKP
jgi:ketosteroid isomerase-like protein